MTLRTMLSILAIAAVALLGSSPSWAGHQDGEGAHSNAGAGNGGEDGAGGAVDSESPEDNDVDPGNSGDHNNAPDAPPGKGGRH